MHKLILQTIREVHQAALAKKSLLNIANQFGMRNVTLEKHLGKKSYINKEGKLVPLTFHALKTEWPNEQEAKKALGEIYDQPINTIDIYKKTIREIHRVIIDSDSNNEAAKKLGFDDATLGRILGKTNYIDEDGAQASLTFKIMKNNWKDEQSAKEALGEIYDQPTSIIKVDLTQKTIRDFHRAALCNNFIQGAAKKLGVSRNTLNRHLSNTYYITKTGEKASLTFHILKNTWLNEEKAALALGDAYDQPLKASAVTLKQRTMREIHLIILDNKAINKAAKILGASADTLESHLGKLYYSIADEEELQLNFKAMREIWSDELIASIAWGEAYDQPINTSKNLKKITLQELHLAIKESNSLSEVATKFEVQDLALRHHLRTITYRTDDGQLNPLTFNALKTQWPNEKTAAKTFGAAYNQAIIKDKRFRCSKKRAKPTDTDYSLHANGNTEQENHLVENSTAQQSSGTKKRKTGFFEPVNYEEPLTEEIYPEWMENRC